MEEVRSYWQVASITHFCTLFNKPFKLPVFEPEELEQAFIIDIPEPPKSVPNQPSNDLQSSENGIDDGRSSADSNYCPSETYEDKPPSEQLNEHHRVQHGSYSPYTGDSNHYQTSQHNEQQQQHQIEQEQPDLHLLVKLAIALLKPHFNCKISHSNWENYLRRIVETNWVELEHHPSPFRIPIITSEGVELTKNLTFNELQLSDKIDLFYALCDYRLWCENSSDLIRDYTIEELRLESIGKDSQGYEYWYFSGARLFREDWELTQDLILRKNRIKELEYKLIDLQKEKIIREQEERRKAELEKARQQANEAREARLAAKRQQEEDKVNSKRKKNATVLPSRTGLRERRSSAASNNNDLQQSSKTPTTRSKIAKQQVTTESEVTQKMTRSSTKSSNRDDEQSQQTPKRARKALLSPEPSRKSPEEECHDELARLAIKPEDRAAAWCVQCESLEDWESFAARFEKTKSTNEKYLYSYINNELLPIIRSIYAKRAAEIRKKEKELMFSLTARRVSSRIISKRAQEEEEERKAQVRDVELQRKKEEAERRLRAELEREMRAKRNRFVINGGTSSTCSDDEDTSGRYNLRQHHEILDDSNEFEGIIRPNKLSEFYEALELIIDTVRTSKHAWPFVDPVPETVPGYYDLIEEPMDLRMLRTKVEFREYKSLMEVEKDFQLLVNNCERFNGPKNVYTKMVYKLWKSFRKNVQLYLQRDLNMDENTTFMYPPPPPNVAPTTSNDDRNGFVQNLSEQPQSLTPEPTQDELEGNTDFQSNITNGVTYDNENTHEKPQLTIKDEPNEAQPDEGSSINSVDSNPLVKGLNSMLNGTVPKLETIPIELPMEIPFEDDDQPPEPVVEEVIIDFNPSTCLDGTLLTQSEGPQPESLLEQ